jgi:xylan 1,4-beta-xylosidase
MIRFLNSGYRKFWTSLALPWTVDRGLWTAFFTALFLQPGFAQTLVLPGDYPDPSVTKIGDAYWASATTSNWAPVFPLLESKDLIHWENRGHVFNQLPAWADYYFWAPEIFYDKGRVYMFYAAHKKGGNLCLGVASADKPQGPYRDHGTLMCEADGSIDAFPIRDEQGKLYVVWKEDGNSIKQPTPIWAAPLNDQFTAFTGEKKELFRNDTPWEANLVEGVSMIRHGEYFYAFYAGAGCCGRGCTYATGVARAKNLLGPWEKYANNPIHTGNDTWKCPGHGTPVEKDGKYYFLYHAYSRDSDVYTGRQGILQEFKFTADGWIQFENTSEIAAAIPAEIKEEFTGKALDSHWQWSVFEPVKPQLKSGKLLLPAKTTAGGAFVAVKALAPNFQAETTVIPSATSAGLGLIGDDQNMVRVLVTSNTITVSKLERDKEAVVTQQPISTVRPVKLRMEVKGGHEITFAYSTDGSNFTSLTPTPIDGKYLPPWDRAVRIGLIGKGNGGQNASFESFSVRNR